MKPFLNLLLVFVGLLLFMVNLSCKKSNDSFTTILGKWNIKIDTFFVGGLASNYEVIYSGKSGDYFNFSSNGKVYIMENSISDTFIYTLKSDSVLIQNFNSGYQGKCLFHSPSTHNIVISTGYYIFYGGGEFGRATYLYR
jgi:hypothetical protein